MINVDEYLFAPVYAGMWQHRDIVENVFTFDDLMDIHEVMAIKAENEKRSYEAAQQKPTQ